MSRFTDGDGSVEDILNYGRWRARVRAVLRGKPAQPALRELLAALEALPEKRLIDGDVSNGVGVCAVGAWALYKRGGIDSPGRPLNDGDNYDDAATDARVALAREFDGDTEWDVAYQLHKELGTTMTLIEYVQWLNDEDCSDVSPEERYRRVLDWVRSHIRGQS